MSHVFPFFSLPRELRDQIYHDIGGIDVRCTVEVPPFDPEDDAHSSPLTCKAIATSKPRVNILLVSRAFGAEYELEVGRYPGPMIRVTQLEPGDFRLPLRRLIKDGPAHRCFRKIKELEVNFEDRLGREDSLVVDDCDRIIHAFAPMMDDPKSIDCNFTFRLTGHENNAHGGNVVNNTPILKTILKRNESSYPDSTVKAPVINHVFLHSSLFSVRSPFHFTAEEFKHDTFYRRHMLENEVRTIIQQCRVNQVMYRATLAADEGTVWGLDLAVDEPYLNFDEAVWAAEAEYEEVMAASEKAMMGSCHLYDCGYVPDLFFVYEEDGIESEVISC